MSARWLIICLILALAWPVVAQDEPGERDFIVEASVDDATPYVGQQIEYVFRYYAHIVPEGGLRDRLPDFRGFWQGRVFDASAGQVVTIDGRQYVVGELIVEITPLRAGRLVIEPAALIVPETLFASQQELETNGVEVNVSQLPPGAPDGFDGAVGQFFADAQVDRTTLTLGEPLTLRLSVTGSGDLQRLPPPDLGLPDDWRVFLNPPRYTASSVTGVRLGEKRFEWLIIPARTGTLSLPSVDLVYFDPDAAEYRVTRTPEFTLNVFPGTDNRTTLPVPSGGVAEDRSALALKPVAALAIPTEADIPWLLWVLGPLVAAGGVAWRFGWRKWRRWQAESRRRMALRHALMALAKAPAERRSAGLLLGVVRRYLNDRTGAELTAVDANTVRHVLAGAGANDEAASEMATIIERVDAMRFLPPGAVDDVQGLIERLVSALRQVDACLD